VPQGPPSEFLFQLNSMRTFSESKILFIDDEQPNLIAFKATFRRKFNVLIASNGKDGAEVIEHHPDVKVVISDQKMDGETGVEFLERMKKSHPDIVRIIITGYTDHDAMNDAINIAHVFRFITKPWKEIDLTKTIESAIELYDQRNNLKSTNKALNTTYDELSKFLYNTVHDMRIPLQVIKKELGTKSNGNNESMQIVSKQIKELDDYLDNLFDYHQTYWKPMNPELISLEVEVDKLIAKQKEEFPEMDISIHKKLSLDTPFYSDKSKLNVILSNLISNGFKYQKQDSNTHELWIEALADANQIEIKVTDNGIGIEESHTEQIFSLNKDERVKSRGLGIGLFVTQKTIEALTGSISVESFENEGSTFTVHLPNLNPARL